jgi:DNA ligase 1
MSRCQLCAEYSTDLHYPVYCDPKIDGVRCLVIAVGGRAYAVSRSGRPIPQAQRIADQFNGMAVDVVFDGELLAGNWRETVAIINTPDHDGAGLTYHVFDGLPYVDWRAGKCGWWLPERQTIVAAATGLDGVHVVNGQMCYYESAVDDYYRKCLDAGFEGIVVKNPRAGYSCRRSSTWRKRKPEMTIDCEITGVYAGGLIVCLPNGDEVRVGGGLTMRERADFWARKDELIGTYAEITMKISGNEGASEWATFKRLRGDK